MDAWPDIAVNTIMQVGQNTLRLMAMGMKGRAPNDGELLHMQEMLEEGLNAGALRFSLGLFTAPGCFSKPDELHALGSVLKKYSARYSSHVRDESHCVHVQLAHMNLSGIDNWGEAQLLLDRIETARSRGVEVHCDQYPIDWGINPLRILLPTWLQEGGMDAMLARLADPYSRSRVRQKIAEVGFNNFGRLESW